MSLDTFRPACPPERESGIALVLVLWVVTLLTVIAGTFAYSTRTHTQLTGNLVSQSRARALADAGVHRALWELARTDNAANRWKADGARHVFALEGGEVAVSIRPESARIDLNSANDTLLKGLFKSAGLAEEDAERLLDAILDWRDTDELVRPTGAEQDQYVAADLRHVPANANFTSVSDLRLVLGMTPELFRQIAPALTVHARTTGIDSRTADREVLLALPGVTVEDVDDYLSSRATWLENGQPVEPFPPAAAYNAGAEGQVYNLRSSAQAEDGAIFSREAVARLSTGAKPPFTFSEWREIKPTTH